VLREDSLSLFFSSLDQPDYNPESLVKWRIAGRNNGDILPTVTGIVLFGKNDLPHYDYAHIRLTRFLGTTMGQVEESREYSLPLIGKIKQLCDDVTAFLRKESYFEGPRRLERTVIPYFAIREALVNAIVHRDYSITSSSIKVNVFDDRLEIISPGILFGSFEIADLGTGLSECRNRSFVRIFRKLGLMEELGTGIARINELCYEKGLQAPQYEEQAQFFRVTIWQNKIQVDLTGQIENKLMMRAMSAAELSNELNIHHNTALKYLKKLITAGRAVKIGSGSRTKYSISP
jgi:ATP-dependent DNA helicase RecG